MYKWTQTTSVDQFIYISEYQKESRRIRLSQIKTYCKNGGFTEITMFDETKYTLAEKFEDFDKRLFTKQS